MSSAKRINIVSIKMVKESSVLYEGRKASSPGDAVKIAKIFLDGADREQLILLCLNVKNEPTTIHTVSVGSLDGSIVHPREIFKTAILSNAHSIILFHNHPSGNTTPSNEDIQVTKRIKEVGVLMGIPLLDHIIIGDENCLSLNEGGYVSFT